MKNLESRLAIVLLAGLLTLAAPSAFPQAPAASNPLLTRDAALAALASPEAARRAEAVVWLANRGTMDDAGRLHERLRDENGLVRVYAERGLWLLWGRSGDPAVDALMARGSDEMRAGRFAEAIATFGEVIRRRPEFAEGWNRRATALFLAGEYRLSIADCDEVLKRNPRHFGALSGRGQIHARLQDYEAALAWYRRALEVNPNMEGVALGIREIERILKERRGRAT